jgi:glycerophosphoryl diester phosphodiesterase
MLPLVFNIALSGYAASSIVLLAFPQLLYKKKNYKHPALQECLEDKKIMRIAHRGGTRKLIENTIAAFEKSEAYTDMLEMDVCETKDNTLVVHHDKTYARICGVDIKTTGLNLE